MSKPLSYSVLSLCACAAVLLGCTGENVGTIGSAHINGEDAGQPPPHDAGQPPPHDAGQQGCTLTWGYWKNHDWPVGSLTLGDDTYTRDQLIAILSTNVKGGDASLILARQLMAAKLNVLSGATAPAAIAEGDAWLIANQDADGLPYGIAPSSAAGQEGIDIAGDLADFNEGDTGPGHCDD